MPKPPAPGRSDPIRVLRAYARAHGAKVRSILYGSANLPGGGRAYARATVDGRSVKIIAGALAFELETPSRSPAPFSLNQPERVCGNQRATTLVEGVTVHASGERGIAAANAWLRSADVRRLVERIASVDAGYGLHVLENEVWVAAATTRLEVLAPALVALAASLETMTPMAPPEEAPASQLPPSLAPLLRFREFAIADDLDRAELFETRSAEVARVAREVEPFADEMQDYLGTPGLVWSDDAHSLSDLLELVLEARVSGPGGTKPRRRARSR